MFDFDLSLYFDEQVQARHTIDMDRQLEAVLCYWYPTPGNFENLRKESLKGWLHIPEVRREVIRCIGCRQPPLKCEVVQSFITRSERERERSEREGHRSERARERASLEGTCGSFAEPKQV